MTSPLIYVAGPLFNTHERWYIEQIAAALEAEGYRTFVPHRDAPKMTGEETQEERFGQIFAADLGAMVECDFCTALLTGADADSGTAAEVGWMAAKGKPVYAITDDFRKTLNIMLWGFCGKGQLITRTIPELVELVKKEQPIG